MPGKRVTAIVVTAPVATSARGYSIEVIAQGGEHVLQWRGEATPARTRLLGLCVLESLEQETDVRIRPDLGGRVGWRWERGYTKAEWGRAAPVIKTASWWRRFRAWFLR